jgi:4'-phosphopantetheinyl transferase
MMWLHPPDNLVLSDDEVHIWRADLDLIDSSLSTFLQLLSPDEKNRAQKFRFAGDRRNFIAARGILRAMIGKYLKINPAEISFLYNEFGKPRIANSNPLHFNISHSQNMAVFAFTKRLNIGIDVEFVNPDVEVKEVAANFFSTNEVMNLLALPERQQTLGFFNCWTRKEAFIKAVGEGLSFPLNTFEVSLEPGKPAELLVTDWDPKAVSQWSMYSMAPGANFIGSLAIEGLVEQVKFWNWQMS